MIYLPQPAMLTMITFHFLFFSTTTFILWKKWLFVRQNNSYKNDTKFRILWYIFLETQTLHIFADFFSLWMWATDSDFFAGLRYTFRNAWLFQYTNILIQIYLLIDSVIRNSSLTKKPANKNIKYLHIVPILLSLNCIPYSFKIIFGFKGIAASVIKRINAVTDFFNPVFNLFITGILSIKFRELIQIIRNNELLRERNEKTIKRWFIFVGSILATAGYYLILGFFLSLQCLGMGPLSESSALENGKVPYLRAGMALDILKLSTTIIIVFLSPYSQIKTENDGR